ncbi:hypothetical protein P4O66_013843 [Electrophorus voltai]|uniref:KH domain-containing, RNA-binding, signal transduction-associated protein 2 n=1 Tax=Electrophorus voltai TaxID=2609070 RepID=A0AAD8Z3K8_9TELE|nr:hypothetical protein P4O66_013843 [Electrophorus voltai]
MEQDKYLPELMAEKESLDPSFIHAMRLLAEEIEKYEGGELRKDGEVKKYLDVISNKNIKLSERVLIPVQQYPKFNFVGKLLGPRGNSMKRLQEETGAKMSILGKGSMRDKGKHLRMPPPPKLFMPPPPKLFLLPTPKLFMPPPPKLFILSAEAAATGNQHEKEEELRKSGEAKYAHLSNDLHVLIEVFAPPGEAYSRMSHALEEIKKFLVPRAIIQGNSKNSGMDYNDEIRQEQLRELSYLNGSDDPSRARSARGRGIRLTSAAATRGRGGVVPPPPPGRGAAAPRGAVGARTSLPTTMLARGVSVPRARGTPGTPGYRPPLLQATPKTYDDFGYDDGYDGEYDDQNYEVYDDGYSNQSKSVSEYYEYGHGTSDDTYNSYAEEEWTQARPGLKAPTARLARGVYREHPYGRY